jgi:hypothetical protein
MVQYLEGLGTCTNRGRSDQEFTNKTSVDLVVKYSCKLHASNEYKTHK